MLDAGLPRIGLLRPMEPLTNDSAMLRDLRAGHFLIDPEARRCDMLVTAERQLLYPDIDVLGCANAAPHIRVSAASTRLPAFNMVSMENWPHARSLALLSKHHLDAGYSFNSFAIGMCHNF